jgi:hypothetical protein
MVRAGRLHTRLLWAGVCAISIRPRSCSYAAVRRCTPSPRGPNWDAQRELWAPRESQPDTVSALGVSGRTPSTHIAHRQHAIQAGTKRAASLGCETQEPLGGLAAARPGAQACAGMSKGQGQRRCLIYLPVLPGTSSTNLTYWARGSTSNSATPSHTT